MRLSELEGRLADVRAVLAEKRQQLSQHDAEVESLKKQQDSVNRWARTQHWGRLFKPLNGSENHARGVFIIDCVRVDMEPVSIMNASGAMHVIQCDDSEGDGYSKAIQWISTWIQDCSRGRGVCAQSSGYWPGY